MNHWVALYNCLITITTAISVIIVLRVIVVVYSGGCGIFLEKSCLETTNCSIHTAQETLSCGSDWQIFIFKISILRGSANTLFTSYTFICANLSACILVPACIHAMPLSYRAMHRAKSCTNIIFLLRLQL